MNCRWLVWASALLLGACHATAQPGGMDLAATDSAPQLQHVTRMGTPGRAADGVLQQRYTFAPAAQPTIAVAPAGGTWAWGAAGELHLRVQNAMAWAVTLDVDIEDARGQHLRTSVGVPAGPAQTLVVPLRAVSPRDQGMQAGPPMPFVDHGQRWLLAEAVTGTLDRAAVRAVHLVVPAPQAPQTLWFGQLEAVAGESTLRDAYTGIVDRYGQYTRGQWPEKVADDAALRAAHARDKATRVAATPPLPVTDRYGGRMQGPALRATGWFHTQKAGGRWHLVTPEGHAFFSLGVNAVSAEGGRTYIQGREALFVDLPPAQGPWADFYGSGDSRRGERGASAGIGFNHGRWFDFLASNLYRIDGRNWLAAWRTEALTRLHAWGFNTIGNWSDPALGRAHAMAYTRSINIAGDYANVATGLDYWGRMPDPFDPRFVQAADAAAAQAASDVRDDPWLLGYFADNELAWAGAGADGRWALALGTLRGDVHSPAKAAWIAILRKQYGDAIALGNAWGLPLTAWEQLDAPGFTPPLPDAAHPAIADDYRAWLRHYADAYFSVVAAAIHRHDPHHLFLGGRFAVSTPEAVAACARHCDVISFNVYADLPQHGLDVATVHGLDKPALISEFHFGSDDRGPFGKGVVSVWNESQRGPAYARFVQAAAEDPAIVGAHWFQYVDQPVTGRLLDGENSHTGLVGITDIPFAGFVRAVTATNLGVKH